MKSTPWMSDFLYPRPTFVEGMARILDWGGAMTQFNRFDQADRAAIGMDWRMVGQDLRMAIAEQLKLPFDPA
jgi:hypothetical protein